MKAGYVGGCGRIDRPPSRRPATGSATLYAGNGGLAEDIEIILALIGRCSVSLAALLGFEDEAATLVAVDPAEAGGAVAIVLKNVALEDVVIVQVVGAAARGWFQPKQMAQAVYEALRVGKFATAGIALLGNEAVDLGLVTHTALIQYMDDNHATQRLRQID